MNRSILTSILFLFLFWGLSLPADIVQVKKLSGPITGEDRVLLQAFVGDQFTPYVNSPFVKSSKEVSKLTVEIQNLVRKIGGELTKPYPIVVLISSKKGANASIAKWTLRKRLEQGGIYIPEEVTPKSVVWEALGLNSEDPLYVLTLTNDLLKDHPRSRVAAAVAHELGHLLEGHLNIEEYHSSMEHWWASQTFETFADKVGIDLLLGKYPIEAMLDLVYTLFTHDKRPSESRLRDFFGEYEDYAKMASATLASHHHEGVRIAAVQAYIEYLRRTDLRAQYERQDLSGSGLNGRDIYRKERNPPNEGKAIDDAQGIHELVTTYLIPQRPFHWMGMAEGFFHTEPLPLADQMFLVEDPDALKIFRNEIQMILSQPISRQAKLNAILTLFELFKGRYWTVHRINKGRFQKRLFEEEVLTNAVKVLLKQGDISLAEFSNYVIKSLPQNQFDLFAGPEQKSKQGPLFFAFKTLSLGNIGPVLYDDPQTRPLVTEYMENLHKVLAEDHDVKRIALEYLAIVIETRTKFHIPFFKVFYEHLTNLSTVPEFSNLLRQIPHLEDKTFLLEFVLRGFQVIQDRKHKDQGNRTLARSLSVLLPEFQTRRLETILSYRHGATEKEQHILEGVLDSVRYLPLKAAHRSQVGEKLLSLVPDETLLIEKWPALPQTLVDLLAQTVKIEILSEATRLQLLRYIGHHYSPVLDQFDDHRPATKLVQLLIRKNPKSAFQNITLTPVSNVERRVRNLLETPHITKLIRERQILDEKIDTLTKQSEGKSDAGKKKIREEKTPYVQRRKQVQEKILNTSQRAASIVRAELWARLSILTAIGHSRVLSQSLSQHFGIQDLKQVFAVLAQLKTLDHIATFPGTGSKIHPSWDRNFNPSLTLFLFDILAAQDLTSVPFPEWYRLFRRIAKFNAQGIEARASNKELFSKLITEAISRMPYADAIKWLKRDKVIFTLTQDHALKTLMAVAKKELPAGSSNEKIERVARNLVENLSLREAKPQLYLDFRNAFVKEWTIQPTQIERIFPKTKEERNTKNTKQFSSHIRGLSGLVELSRQQSFENQIWFLEYLVGRRTDPPHFVKKATEDLQHVAPVDELIASFRQRLAQEDAISRAALLNAFLAGPDSIVDNPTQRAHLRNHILKNINPENKKIADAMAEALVRSLGKSGSMIFAYVMAQKPSQEGKPLSEGEMLKSAFEAFGVAGVKMGQYLAFISELGPYAVELRDLQDGALKPSHYDMLKTIVARTSGKWPVSLRVVNLIGSGSVNLAVRYEHGGKEEIVSILREDIEIQIEESFRKLTLFIAELVNDKVYGHRFEFLLGLVPIIKKSVLLELDKLNSAKIQSRAVLLYDRKIEVNGQPWKLQAPKVIETAGGFIRMEKAPGVTAKKLAINDPGLYQEVMKAFARVELDVLFGVDESGRPKPVHLFANPDLHDGQVLVDVTTRTITILDFGQAVDITNKEREIALELVRGLEFWRLSKTVKHGRRVLQNKSIRSFENVLHGLGSPRTKLTLEDLKTLTESSDRMDVFIKSLALLTKVQGGESLPISVVHWALGINRLIQLGHKIGYNVEAHMFHAVLFRSLRLPIKWTNRTRGLVDIFERVFRSRPHVCSFLSI